MSVHTSTVVFTLLAAFAWTVISYHGYATHKGWAIGGMFADNTSMVKLASLIGLPGAAIAAAYLAVWWSALVVVVVGWVLSLVLTIILRSFVQPVAVAGLAFCWVIGILMLSQA